MVYYHIVQQGRTRWMVAESYQSDNVSFDDMMKDDDTKFFISKDFALEYVEKILGV
jgi:hypothetical protein